VAKADPIIKVVGGSPPGGAFMTNLSLYLVESADTYPDGPALRCDRITTTFSERADSASAKRRYCAPTEFHRCGRYADGAVIDMRRQTCLLLSSRPTSARRLCLGEQ
jgi:hypothetical protein